MKLSAIVITLNEEKNIGSCLASLSLADELLVIDSGSTDATVSIARSSGAKVFVHAFSDFASQRNFALEQATGDWILFVDADETVTPELTEEIRSLLDQNPKPCLYKLPRHTYFLGHLLRFGDSRNDAPIRLFPRNHVAWTQPVHETVSSDLPCGSLKNVLLHYSTRDWNHYQEKIRLYIPLELVTMRKKEIQASLANILMRPAARFFSVYFLNLGVLDGFAGLQYATLSAYYTFLKHWLYLKSK